jgi:hypothetical protein
MRQQFIRRGLINQIISLRRSFAQGSGGLFDRVLPLKEMVDGLEGITYRNRLFSPVVTLRYFLLQTLSADHSCREMVGQKIAEAVKAGEKPCSLNTASYCAARKRLSGAWVPALLRRSGKELHKKSVRLWRGRSVKLIDGTTVSMPDTPENQGVYPQIKEQKTGIGFPIARLVCIISLSCGAVLDVAIGAYEGKGSGEHSLLRKIIGNFKKKTSWWAMSITAAIG